MSQHGRRRAAAPAPVVDDEPVARFGFVTMETALVLGLVLLIAAGSFLVHVAFPSNRASETVIGDQKVRITTVGKGGVMPGPVEPRVITPVAVPTPVPAAMPIKTPKPRKTPKPAAGAPTPTPTPQPGKGGGNTSPLPGGGGGGGGGGQCTVLILCKPGQKPAPTPEPVTEPVTDPATDPAQPPAAGQPKP